MLSIIKRDMLSLMRDRGGLFFIVLFPSLLVFLLGNLLQGMDASDEAIETIHMAYVVEATDPSAVQAIEAFTTALNENAAIELYETRDAEVARRQVDVGDLAAVVRFTQPFGAEIYEGFDNVQNRAIDSIFNGFSRQVGSLAVLAQHAPQQLESAAHAAADGATGALVKQKEFGYNRSMLDYYAVAMVVMIAFMGSAIAGATTLYDGRKDGTLQRQLASPKNHVNMYIQSVAGTVTQGILQVACVMLAGTLLFGAHYADSWQSNLLLAAMLVLVSMTTNAFGMILGMLVPVNPMVIVMPLLWVMMFFSGTFSKEIAIEGVTEYSPAWLIQNAAFDLTVFGRAEKTVMVMLWSVALLALATAAGALLYRRKGLVAK